MRLFRVSKIVLFVERTFSASKAEVRVRFAPSPTGNLHLGGLRTAMYNYLFARKNQGKFVLRIEDTDQKRVVPEAINNISSMLEWTGLIPDESPLHGGPYSPYLQSENIGRYIEKANLLLENGLAYRCFCSETRLALLRKEAMKNRQNPGYDNKCRHLESDEIKEFLLKGQPYTIRFKIDKKPMTYEDTIFGSQTLDISEYEGDFIIIKSDQYPTYHFACVVDDHAMAISHVLRGSEWLSSTTKHLMIYNAFQWKTPVFAHLPLLVNSDRTKLSKRQEALGIDYFKNQGYEPLALINFLAGIGAGFGYQTGCNVFELEELAEKFNLSEINTNSCVLDLPKLEVYNQNYLAKQFYEKLSTSAQVEKFRTLLKQELGERYNQYSSELSDSYIHSILSLFKERISKLSELIHPEMKYLWDLPDICNIEDKLEDIQVSKSDAIHGVREAYKALSSISELDFNKMTISTTLQETSKDVNLKYTIYMRMLRVVITGLKDGPGVSEICALLNKEKCLKRLEYICENFEPKKVIEHE